MKDPTTIQISEDLRVKLKVMASYRKCSYKELIDDMLYVFNDQVKFSSVDEFAEWFEENYKGLGYKSVEKVEKNSKDTILYNVVRSTKKEKVLLSMFDRDLNLTDEKAVICVFSTKEKLGDTPVTAINLLSSNVLTKNGRSKT